MEITRSVKPLKDLADVKMWHCNGCGVVHMSVREMILDFSRDEFAAFTEAVVDIQFSGWPGEESIIDLVDHEAELYADAVVH